jgi:hypothetical protein
MGQGYASQAVAKQKVIISHFAVKTFLHSFQEKNIHPQQKKFRMLYLN